MKVIIISGAPNSGKTTTLRKFFEYLTSEGYNPIETNWKPELSDFYALFEMNSKLVLIHSACDDSYWVNELKQTIEKNQPDIVLTTARDGVDCMREEVAKTFQCTLNPEDYSIVSNDESLVSIKEIPLGKVTRRNSRDEYQKWYHEQILKLLIVVFNNEIS